MYPKAAVDVSMLVPSISHAQIPNPVKCKMPLQSPTFSRVFNPKITHSIYEDPIYLWS